MKIFKIIQQKQTTFSQTPIGKYVGLNMGKCIIYGCAYTHNTKKPSGADAV